MAPEKTPRDRAEELISLLVPDWRPTAWQGLWAIRIVLAIVVGLGLLTVVGQPFGITLWDWLKLLVVPAVIAGVGLWFNRQQRERELEIAERRTQDEALQAYLDQMSYMLIPNADQPSLYKARPGDSLSSVARARTLTVLSRLDGERKARVLQFLYESGLIAKNHPFLALSKADLSGADLRGVFLGGADLGGVNLRNADLSDAYLSETDLSGANLSEAILRTAISIETDLSGADLTRADLSEAILQRSDLSRTILENAVLRKANLDSANLSGAHGRRQRLSTLSWIYQGIPNEEIDKQAFSLEGATMPNGQKYEDWLKDREGRKENAENE